MVSRENKSNTYAKFWRDKQSIMVFLKVANTNAFTRCDFIGYYCGKRKYMIILHYQLYLKRLILSFVFFSALTLVSCLDCLIMNFVKLISIFTSFCKHIRYFCFSFFAFCFAYVFALVVVVLFLK